MRHLLIPNIFEHVSNATFGDWYAGSSFKHWTEKTTVLRLGGSTSSVLYDLDFTNHIYDAVTRPPLAQLGPNSDRDDVEVLETPGDKFSYIQACFCMPQTCKMHSVMVVDLKMWSLMTLDNSKGYGLEPPSKTLQDKARTRLNSGTPHQVSRFSM